MKSKAGKYIQSEQVTVKYTQPKTIKYTWTDVNGKKQYRYEVEKACMYCKKDFWTRKTGKTTAIYCGKSCASKEVNSRPAVREKMDRNKKKPLPVKECLECGEKFTQTRHGKEASKQRFCSQSCSAKWRMRQPEVLEAQRSPEKIAKNKAAAIKQMQDPALRLMYSERMKETNPMHLEEVRKLVSEKKKGKPFNFRAGNGQLTEPQIRLHKALGLSEESIEYPIITASVKDQFSRIPNCYKSDIAIPEIKLSIEVDGHSHKAFKVKAQDELKTKVLNSLGWKVIRFWNQEILEDLPKVLKEINTFMTSK
jgi:DNA replication protein DnaD